MKFPRRQFLRLAAGAAAFPAVSRIARAEAYRRVLWPRGRLLHDCPAPRGFSLHGALQRTHRTERSATCAPMACARSPCHATSATTRRSSTPISGRVKCSCRRSGRGWSAPSAEPLAPMSGRTGGSASGRNRVMGIPWTISAGCGSLLCPATTGATQKPAAGAGGRGIEAASTPTAGKP
jgi:hypothetical protein